jgi:3-deoxy-7-phosphoheptulonate synthase
MIDCSHGNCRGDYRRQTAVGEEVARQLAAGSSHILGLMIESNLLPGSQKGTSGRPWVPAQSITDPCLGTEDTAELLSALIEHRPSSCVT